MKIDDLDKFRVKMLAHVVDGVAVVELTAKELQDLLDYTDVLYERWQLAERLFEDERRMADL